MAGTKAAPKTVSLVQGAIIIVVVLGAILTGAYYQEDIGTYFRLHGWDSASPQEFVRTFIRQASTGDKAAVAALDAQRLKPVLRKEKLDAVQHPGPMGPVVVPLSKFIPSAEVKETGARVRYKPHNFEVVVQYPNGRWASFGADRTPEGWRITSVPDSLSDSRPQPLPWE